MKVAIGTDHAGLTIKSELVAYLEKEGYTVIDKGAFDFVADDDYVDFAEKVALSVADGEAQRGILVCMTGIGMSVAANKVKGIRAGLVFNEESASLTRQHNDTNVLVIPGKFMPIDTAKKVCDVWLSTEFSNGERHARRVAKISDMEGRYFK